MFGAPAARRGVLVAALLACAVIVAASGTDEVQQGEVVVLITDHREAIDDFSSLVVTATGARLHRRGHVPEEGWTVIEAPREEVDLTRYRDGVTFELVRAPVAAGRYDAADLILAGPARARSDVPPIPVFRGRGVQPGVDLTDNAALEAIMDAEPCRGISAAGRPDTDQRPSGRCSWYRRQRSRNSRVLFGIGTRAPAR